MKIQVIGEQGHVSPHQRGYNSVRVFFSVSTKNNWTYSKHKMYTLKSYFSFSGSERNLIKYLDRHNARQKCKYFRMLVRTLHSRMTIAR